MTLLHAGVLPVLAGFDGVLFKDLAAHRSIHEGCQLAQAGGAEFVEFRHNDVADLEARLRRYPTPARRSSPSTVCIRCREPIRPAAAFAASPHL